MSAEKFLDRTFMPTPAAISRSVHVLWSAEVDLEARMEQSSRQPWLHAI